MGWWFCNVDPDLKSFQEWFLNCLFQHSTTKEVAPQQKDWLHIWCVGRNTRDPNINTDARIVRFSKYGPFNDVCKDVLLTLSMHWEGSRMVGKNPFFSINLETTPASHSTLFLMRSNVKWAVHTWKAWLRTGRGKSRQWHGWSTAPRDYTLFISSSTWHFCFLHTCLSSLLER